MISAKLDVSVLPIGHERTDIETYYQFKIITVGQRSVGKSMSEWTCYSNLRTLFNKLGWFTVLQYFTKEEDSRKDTLPSTVGPKMDIVNRFLTTQGELVETILWDTGACFSFLDIHFGTTLIRLLAGQETFRAMSVPLVTQIVFFKTQLTYPFQFVSWVERRVSGLQYRRP